MIAKMYAWYLLAAFAEIGGCFAFWAWLRLGRSGWLALPGVASLVLFALALTRIETDAAGRAYAAYCPRSGRVLHCRHDANG
ncbi:MAG: YnfA family protein [Solidesulfovibrio sp.]